MSAALESDWTFTLKPDKYRVVVMNIASSRKVIIYTEANNPDDAIANALKSKGYLPDNWAEVSVEKI